MKYKKPIFFLCLLFFPPFLSCLEAIEVDELVGNIKSETNSELVLLIDSMIPVSKEGMYLQKEALTALLKVYNQFKKDNAGIPFVVLSATRTFEYQAGIWGRKWESFSLETPQERVNKILEYSSLPGTSRHHWGTDIDLISLSPSYFLTPQGGKVYAWLSSHMPQYGFFQCFNAGRKEGYKEEKWHWSYIPLAKKYIKDYALVLKKNPQLMVQKIRKVKGMKDIKEAQILALIKTYVFGINPQCLTS